VVKKESKFVYCCKNKIRVERSIAGWTNGILKTSLPPCKPLFLCGKKDIKDYG
jgi:hypothetical protein